MTVLAASHSLRNPHIARQRERREALGTRLAELMRALDRQPDISLMRGAFEEMVRRLVSVKTVQLRDGDLSVRASFACGV